jgi:hypothetical protein
MNAETVRNLSTNRSDKALKIKEIRKVSASEWLVKNKYTVLRQKDAQYDMLFWHCSCPDHTFHRNYCKHIMAVILLEDIR